MKRILTFPFLLLFLFSCEKEEKNNDQVLLREHIFNGHTRWVITRMEADTEREIQGQNTLIWSDYYPACRKDNVFHFSSLGAKIASIHVDENGFSCDLEEPDFISQGLVLDFSNDLQKASVFVKGAALAKIFDLPYDSSVKNFDFDHSWEFEETTKEKVIVKVMIPSGQSAGMVDKAATVWITFEREN